MITIVSGLPRSGTSLMMQMLSGGGIAPLTDHLRTADEDNPRGYLEFEAVKKTRHDSTWLNEAEGKVVKMVHLLLQDLPLDRSYRIVFMQRELSEVVASQQKMLTRSGKSGAALSAEQLMKIYRAQVDAVLAYVRRSSNFMLIEVSYNALLADAVAQVQRLNAFCGGTLDETKMLLAIDPSLYRNRAK